MSDTSNFYEQASKCPWVQRLVTECPWLKRQVEQCPYLSSLFADKLQAKKYKVDIAAASGSGSGELVEQAQDGYEGESYQEQTDTGEAGTGPDSWYEGDSYQPQEGTSQDVSAWNDYPMYQKRDSDLGNTYSQGRQQRIPRDIERRGGHGGKPEN